MTQKKINDSKRRRATQWGLAHVELSINKLEWRKWGGAVPSRGWDLCAAELSHNLSYGKEMGKCPPLKAKAHQFRIPVFYRKLRCFIFPIMFTICSHASTNCFKFSEYKRYRRKTSAPINDRAAYICIFVNLILDTLLEHITHLIGTHTWLLHQRFSRNWRYFPMQHTFKMELWKANRRSREVMA